MDVQKNMEINNVLAEDLTELIKLVKDDKISIVKASTINRLALTTIKASKEGVLMIHHQQIQRDKVEMHQKEIDVKYRHILLQQDKLNIKLST